MIWKIVLLSFLVSFFTSVLVGRWYLMQYFQMNERHKKEYLDEVLRIVTDYSKDKISRHS